MVSYLNEDAAKITPTSSSTPAVPHYVRDEIEVTNAFQSVLGAWPQNDGAFLYDLPEYNAGNPQPCVPTNYFVPVGVRSLITHDVIVDTVRESEVMAQVSRRIYAGGMTISGFDVIFITQVCPATLTQIRYTAATTSLDMSVDGGVSWFPFAQDVSATPQGEVVALIGGLSTDRQMVYVQRNADPLPVVDTVSTLSMDIARWAFMFFSFEAGTTGSPAVRPYEMAADLHVEFYVPIITDFGSIPAIDRILKMYDDVLFKDIVTPDLIGSGGLTGHGDIAVTALNTLDPLPATPVDPAATELKVNGNEIRYGVDYTLAGTAITLIPAALGYNVDTGDWVHARVW
jgi:hypothetical protein